jgi:hypothetical protein
LEAILLNSAHITILPWEGKSTAARRGAGLPLIVRSNLGGQGPCDLDHATWPAVVNAL